MKEKTTVSKKKNTETRLTKNESITNVKKVFSWHKFTNSVWSWLLAITAVATVIFGINYDKPNDLFWDENYHIVSAEKSLQGVAFMENHPPLGKLFIALGELILQPNKDIDKTSMVSTDYLKNTLESRSCTPKSGYVATTQQAGDIADKKEMDTCNPVYVKKLSFAGYRLFPVIFSILSVPVFWMIGYLILRKNTFLATLVSSLLLFDNAIVLHFRGAMLESTQMFFVLSSILVTLLVWYRKTTPKLWEWILLGILVGLTAATKINGLIILLLPLLWVIKFTNWSQFDTKSANLTSVSKNLKLLSKIVLGYLGFGAVVAVTFCLVFVVFISFGKKVVDFKKTYDVFSLTTSVENKGKSYNFSDKSLLAISDGKQLEPYNLIRIIKENLEYSDNYNKGVPKLDVCKEGENGSYPLNWLLINKTINYRWQKSDERPSLNFFAKVDDIRYTKSSGQLTELAPKTTDDKGAEKTIPFVSYMYLMGNPVIWYTVLAALIIGLVLIIGKVLFGIMIKDFESFTLIVFFSVVFIGYMAITLSINRVLYLYHYFLPLVFGMIIFISLIQYAIKASQGNEKKLILIETFVATLAVMAVISFIFFAPFTYYLPLSADEFRLRNILPIWGLKVVT
jgi:dolichyl-phosphate-mannose-protein mannosyltransferase